MRRALPFAFLLAVALTFSPVLENGFTSWDDDVYVTANPLVVGFPHRCGEIFTSFVSGNYQPLVVLLHAAEYRLFGADPRPYHALNLALHLLVTALVFHLLSEVLGGSVPAAAAGTLLFALHPQRVEAVAWVSARKDLLGAAFFLGGLAAYLRHLRRPVPRRFLAVLALFLLALLSKGTTVVFPLALLLVDWLRGRLDRRAVAGKVPLLALSALFGTAAIAARSSYQGVLQEGSLSAFEALFLAAYRLVCHYPARLVLPATHAFPLYPSPGPGTGPLVLGLLALTTAIGVAAALVALTLRHNRVVAFGALFFLVTVLPSLTVEVLGFSADRFTYLPAFGVSCMAGEGVRRLLAGRGGATAAGRAALFAAATAAAIWLALESRERCKDWRDSVSLWTAAVDEYRAAPVAAHNLAQVHAYRGEALARRGDTEAALADLDRAVELFPGNPWVLAVRGRIRADGSDQEGARRDYDAALRIEPRQIDALIGRGILFAEAGDFESARRDFGAALVADPRSEAALNLGVLYLNRGEATAALPFFERAAEVDRGGAAFYGRAQSRLALGDARGAAEDFARAAALGYRVDPAIRDAARAAAGEEDGPRP